MDCKKIPEEIIEGKKLIGFRQLIAAFGRVAHC